MYILNLDEHKNLTLKRGKSYVGENNADTITCYLPTNFKQYDLKDCFVLLHIYNENNDGTSTGDVIQLEIEEELYKGKYVAKFDLSRTYTTKVQTLFLKIEILNSNEVVAFTNNVSFDISENKNITSSLPNIDTPIFEEFVVRLNNLEAQILQLRSNEDSIKRDIEFLKNNNIN